MNILILLEEMTVIDNLIIFLDLLKNLIQYLISKKNKTVIALTLHD